MSTTWLPEGYNYDLHVEHDRGGDAGAFTGGGWKMLWHITVSRWDAVDGMVNVLRDKGAEPHVVVGGRPGVRHPVAVQMVPFDRAGRSVQHVLAPETNRANAIQVEICAQPGSMLASLAAHADPGDAVVPHAGHDLFGLPGLDHAAMGMTPDDDDLCMTEVQHRGFGVDFSSGVAAWGEETYKALANLTRLINVTLPTNVPMALARRFTNTDRYSGQGFVNAEGHLGHCHVPGNTHVDPTTDFKGSHLISLLDDMPSGGYQL